MKTLILPLILATLAAPAFADSAACTWKTAENGNFLVRTGNCDDGLSGGYFAASTVTEKGVTTTTHNGRPSEGPRTTVEIAAH
jgi:hypothetical protein